MDHFFAYDYQGRPFELFGLAHIMALLCIFLLNIYLLRFRSATDGMRRRVRIGLAGLLWLDETAWHIWNLYHGSWSVQEHLPLHACSILIWLTGFMLIFKSHTIYEFSYFVGIGGAFQALVTPDLGIYGFPHFRFFQTYISHVLLLTAAICMTTVEGMRPTWRSLFKVIIYLNLYMVGVFLINRIIGSNYLYVAHKPPGPTLLDVLPEWPWYLLHIEGIGSIVFILLYLPFAIKDWRNRHMIPVG